jgi:hypothetical protein
MELINNQLQKYYHEYYKLQHLDIDNHELKELTNSNFDNFIIPNIKEIIEILEDFIRIHLDKSNKNLIIFDWIDHIFNSKIYKLKSNSIKEKKLFSYYVMRINLIKLTIFKEFVDSNKYTNVQLNSRIIECENIIFNYYNY